MGLLITNIKKLCQVEMNPPQLRRGLEMNNLPCIDDAFLYCNEDRISDYGLMIDMPSQYLVSSKIIDAAGSLVLPGFCDSHTHLVYSGSREMEFIDKIKGLSYEEIAKMGGGILNSAKLLHEISENELYIQSVIRVKEIMSLGTVAIEIKSGYGLTIEDEIKMLRVIQRIKKDFPLTVKSTFLGAHTFPPKYRKKHEAYLDLIIKEMIPAISKEGLADFIDVFCDKGFFSPSETAKILEAGIDYGMRPKIHANELDYSGGIQVGVEHDALSVDHLEFIADKEIDALLKSRTIPTLLPATSFFLGINYSPARKMIDRGLPVALASDYNPGSSPSGNMNFIIALASIKLGMYPEEAVNAVTLNGAYAMGIEEDHGTISPGKYASFIITKKISGIEFLPYAFGTNLIESVFIKGLQLK